MVKALALIALAVGLSGCCGEVTSPESETALSLSGEILDRLRLLESRFRDPEDRKASGAAREGKSLSSQLQLLTLIAPRVMTQKLIGELVGAESARYTDDYVFEALYRALDDGDRRETHPNWESGFSTEDAALYADLAARYGDDRFTRDLPHDLQLMFRASVLDILHLATGRLGLKWSGPGMKVGIDQPEYDSESLRALKWYEGKYRELAGF
jgi:hypothetical protein